MTTSPDQADAHFHQGMEFVKSGDFASAAESFRRAAEADAHHSPAHNNLGAALAALGRHAEAAEAFGRALWLEPGYAQAHFNLGVSLRTLGRRDESVRCLMRAIELDPNHDEAHYYVGLAYQAQGQLTEAYACYERAAQIAPGDAQIQTALGSVLIQLRRVSMAIAAFERALSLNPNDAMARAHLMYWLARDCEWGRLEAHREWIPRLGVTGEQIAPFLMLAFEDNPERHRIRSEKFAAASYAMIEPLPPPPRPSARPQRLRIGYFSADFREHATMFLAARMFEAHDRGRFSIHAYSYGRDDSGPMRGRALQAFDEFKEVRELSDQAIAQVARDDGIDIAIDLKGYTQHQRVGIFAYRPAPIQMTFLGYPGTLGAPFMDYLVTDPIVVPDAHRHAYTEQLLYLPGSYQVNDNSRPIPRSGGSRSAAGLPRDGFVFCCFNASYKITPTEFGIWMDLLAQVEGSVLWLLAKTDNVAVNLRLAAEKRGIDPARLVFAPNARPAEHMARQPLADLFLDTFDCNAHTTASDALWAGVPLVTKAGAGFAARVAASLLRAVGLGELVTNSARDYAELALALATDPVRLAALRKRLEANRTTAPLFDSALFALHFEAGFDLAYQRYLDGEPPADLVVPA